MQIKTACEVCFDGYAINLFRNIENKAEKTLKMNMFFVFRHWMVIRRDGAFLSARKEPKLVLIKPSSEGDNLLLDAPGMPTLVLPICPPIDKSSKLIKCRFVYNDILSLNDKRITDQAPVY